MANKTTSAAIVVDNLSKTHKTKSLIKSPKLWSTCLLLEKIPLAGIARVAGVSEPWLQSYVNEKYQNVPRQVKVQAKKRGA